MTPCNLSQQGANKGAAGCCLPAYKPPVRPTAIVYNSDLYNP